MFNERIKSMGIESYHVYDNTTNYKDYQANWASAVSPPPKNATDVKGCAYYIVKIKYERWVTYTRYYIYHHLCKNRMSEHNLSVEQFMRDNIG